MRLTRAALRAGAQDVDNETADASKPHTDGTDAQDRVPLGEVSANTAMDNEAADPPTKKAAMKKPRAAKKGAKGKKAKAAQEEEEEEGEEEPDVVLEEEGQAVGGPANDAVVHNMTDDPTAGALPDDHLKMRC